LQKTQFQKKQKIENVTFPKLKSIISEEVYYINAGEAALFLCLWIQLVGFSDQLNFSPK